ncbi:hypothetical protein D7I39_11040 [Allopusillimonas ginsengisoli]|nr:hypothetical protein D7I39_11040 [Allopusillimonas ginsengisoli]
MKKMMVILLTLGLAGCSTYAVPRYSVSTDTVAALRAVGDVQVEVGEFLSAKPTGPNDRPGEIMCRGVGPIKTPDGESYAEYVRKALISELIIANIYSKEAPIELTGSITALDFESMGGSWTVGLELRSSNGKSVAITNTYKYQSSFYGETACNQTAQAGLGAIQDAIRAAVTHKDFPALLEL